MKVRRVVIACAAVALLAGCSGSGDDDSASSSTAERSSSTTGASDSPVTLITEPEAGVPVEGETTTTEAATETTAVDDAHAAAAVQLLDLLGERSCAVAAVNRVGETLNSTENRQGGDEFPAALSALGQANLDFGDALRAGSWPSDVQAEVDVLAAQAAAQGEAVAAAAELPDVQAQLNAANAAAQLPFDPSPLRIALGVPDEPALCPEG